MPHTGALAIQNGSWTPSILLPNAGYFFSPRSLLYYVSCLFAVKMSSVQRSGVT